MGKIYNNKTLLAKELSLLPSPILLCVDRADYNKVIADAGYWTISLNLPLARSLDGLSLSDIQSTIGDKIRDALPLSGPIYLTDYEMLFDPRYELDIIRMFIDISRRNKLIVKWCGVADESILTYAEHGYEDYKKIKTSDYDITVII